MLLASGQTGAQDGAEPHPLFADDTPLTLKLTAPFNTVARDDDAEEREEYPAVIEFPGSDGSPSSLDIEVRIRGKSRASYCDFPPLSLDFPRGETSGTVFEGQNRLKLVVQCKTGSRYRAYLVKEFLIYRMLNALTDRSFRVRWSNVEFVYTDSRRPETRIEPAFLIEEDWEAAERLGMEVVDVEKPARESLDFGYTTLLILFQYLIANTDWAVIDGPEGEFCCHNGKVLQKDEGPYVVLAYDFDSSGLVNAEYAAPTLRQIRYVTQRLYRGFCIMNDEVEGAIALLNSRRELLLDILDSDLLEERDRESAVKFVEGGFEVLNDPKDLERRIYEDCR